MVLEATMICLDNSEWMRNGDYPPSRLDAQQDAVNLLCSVKVNQNPENTVGVLTSAGTSARVLITQTQDLGKVLQTLHDITLAPYSRPAKGEVVGSDGIAAAIQKACLALKHRQNQNQRPRVVVFVGSPIVTPAEELVKLGKKMKKNGVRLDVICFGEVEQNEEKLQAFVAAADPGPDDESGGCHFLSVPVGSRILSDVLLTSEIVSGGGSGRAGPSSAGGGADGGDGGGGGDFPFGVDPSIDPELAMALRISMEEEKARQESMQKDQAGSAAAAGEAGAAAEPGAAAAQEPSAMDLDKQGEGENVDVEDEMLRVALQMSVAESEAKGQAENPAGASESVADVVGSLPGLDQNDESVKKALDEKKDKGEEK